MDSMHHTDGNIDLEDVRQISQIEDVVELDSRG